MIPLSSSRQQQVNSSRRTRRSNKNSHSNINHHHHHNNSVSSSLITTSSPSSQQQSQQMNSSSYPPTRNVVHNKPPIQIQIQPLLTTRKNRNKLKNATPNNNNNGSHHHPDRKENSNSTSSSIGMSSSSSLSSASASAGPGAGWRRYGMERRKQLIDQDIREGGNSFDLNYQCRIQGYFSLSEKVGFFLFVVCRFTSEWTCREVWSFVLFSSFCWFMDESWQDAPGVSHFLTKQSLPMLSTKTLPGGSFFTFFYTHIFVSLFWHRLLPSLMMPLPRNEM